MAVLCDCVYAKVCAHAQSVPTCVCMFVCVHVSVQVYVRVHVSVQVCVHVHVTGVCA